MGKGTKPTRAITATAQDLQKLMDLGYNFADAGRLWNVSRAAVQQFAKKHGIHSPKERAE